MSEVLTQAEYWRLQAEAMPEALLLQHVRDLATTFGWLRYHTHRSERSEPGFPDLVLVHPKARRLVFAELKRQKTHLTERQEEWYHALLGVWTAVEDMTADLSDIHIASPVISVHIWRPSDLFDGSIEAVLRP